MLIWADLKSFCFVFGNSLIRFIINTRYIKNYIYFTVHDNVDRCMMYAHYQRKKRELVTMSETQKKTNYILSEKQYRIT